MVIGLRTLISVLNSYNRPLLRLLSYSYCYNFRFPTDYEELVVEEFREGERARIEAAQIRDYRNYAGPVQETYSNVVSNTLGLLRGKHMYRLIFTYLHNTDTYQISELMF